MGNNYGATHGSNLAYQEGIATYLEQVAIADGDLPREIPGLPADSADSAYMPSIPRTESPSIPPPIFSSPST